METDTTHSNWLASAYRGGRAFSDPFYCEWGAVVGDRVRRLRRVRDRPLADLARALRKPGGGHYSAGFVSRLERGRASAPLFVYLAIADELEVDAGVLLGSDAATLQASDSELTLLRCLRKAGIVPHDLLAVLIEARQRPPDEVEPDPAVDLVTGLRALLGALDGDQ